MPSPVAVTVTNATWKAKNFFHGPVNSETANPKVIQEPLPANWWAIDFDDIQDIELRGRA